METVSALVMQGINASPRLRRSRAADGALVILYARLTLSASSAVLAAMAATTLLNGERMCERVLESPGVEEPLSALHTTLSHFL